MCKVPLLSLWPPDLMQFAAASTDNVLGMRLNQPKERDKSPLVLSWLMLKELLQLVLVLVCGSVGAHSITEPQWGCAAVGLGGLGCQRWIPAC